MPTLAELAALAGARLLGDGTLTIDRVSAAQEAVAGSLTFAVDERWLEKAVASRASAVIVPQALASADARGKALLVCSDVRAALASILASFAPPLPKGPFTDPSAIVERGVRRGADVWVGGGAIVRAGAALADGAIILSGAYVGVDAGVGRRTLLHPRATVLDGCIVGDDCILASGCVIGSDGFGFVRVGEDQIKIPQIGNVILGDRVEIGACTTIDRAVTGSTTIGSGTKIDNQVQVAHNVRIGENCTVCAQVGIAGSATIGRLVTIAGQAGVGGHIEIGERSLIMGGAKVSHSLPAQARVSGYPAQPHRADMEQKVHLRSLPKLVAQMRALAEAVDEIRKSQ
ncbi:MAG: UDP-3-O-(3-hydroxymyristoyl)glucosamine N-acyltransferase [Candidatus Eremiobacteraeota bacterium]|nr:UDP-3-O-(3-hydroxymyristoyl)glucosamine N-acyltransferase [Candidatus Eremiobacteraeota bacterium]MBC5828251.1 UDP-3-O-(3-hydroxymyristoyl)glucosamine N-acyltransferase [Candidatus Eremiobacteraeota bacterium]